MVDLFLWQGYGMAGGTLELYDIVWNQEDD